MKTLILSSFLLWVVFYKGQSFEEIIFPDISTTISSSRSANFLDLNNDGWDDIFFSNGLSTGQKNMVYLNNQDGTFTTVTNDDIVLHTIRAVGASFADVDNDGDNDAYVVTWGSGGQPRRNYFYRNIGNGHFDFEENVAPTLTYSETAIWMDANNDQYLDLYITNSAGSLKNLYYENQKNGTFLLKPNHVIVNELLPSRSADWVDYDSDGDNDLFVTNEGNNANTLYQNQGNNQFLQIFDNTIVEDSRDSMGSSWADIDNDGDFDLLVTNNNAPNQLFINNGSGNFTENLVSEIAQETTNSFGSSFADLDNDGDLDLLIANAYSSTHFKNSVFINDGNGHFTKDNTSTLAKKTGWTYSAAFGDYNNDGWLDVILANNQNEAQTNSVFKNTGSGNNWTKIRLTGTISNRSAIGAVIKLSADIDDKSITQTRKVESASGYCSQNSLSVHFGLRHAAIIKNVEIRWPSGLVENFENLSINAINNLVEGTGNMKIIETKKINVNIYPNPTKELIHLDFKNEKSANSFQIKLMDTSGKLILQQHIQKTKQHTINIQSLQKGIYVLHIQSDNQNIYTGKIVKQ